MVNMAPPNNKKEMCLFIGIVNYYRDVWDRRSHLIHPLTSLTSNKVKLKCTDVEQKVFDYIKCSFAQDTLLAYPYFNRRLIYILIPDITV